MEKAGFSDLWSGGLSNGSFTQDLQTSTDQVARYKLWADKNRQRTLNFVYRASNKTRDVPGCPVLFLRFYEDSQSRSSLTCAGEPAMWEKLSRQTCVVCGQVPGNPASLSGNGSILSVSQKLVYPSSLFKHGSLTFRRCYCSNGPACHS